MRGEQALPPGVSVLGLASRRYAPRRGDLAVDANGGQVPGLVGGEICGTREGSGVPGQPAGRFGGLVPDPRLNASSWTTERRFVTDERDSVAAGSSSSAHRPRDRHGGDGEHEP